MPFVRSCTRVDYVRIAAITSIALLVALLTASPAAATFPGANGKIVFSKGGDLWTINPDGSNLTQLTTGPINDTGPVWSPDGAAIAFQRGDKILIRSHSGAIRQFGDYPESDLFPAWSPDGRRLAFI